MAYLNHPNGLTVDRNGDLLLYERAAVRSLADDGTLRTVVGAVEAPTIFLNQLPGPARQVPVVGAVEGVRQSSVVESADGTLYVVNANGVLRVADGTVYPFVGYPLTDPLNATIGAIGGLAVDKAGQVYVSDEDNHRVLRFDAVGGSAMVLAGTGIDGSTGDGGPARYAQLSAPEGLAVDDGGNLYIADARANVIRKVDPAGSISTAVGTGEYGFGGDGGPATAGRLAHPTGLVLDGRGDLFIADSFNARIRRVSPDGGLSTVVGGGAFGQSGDGGAAREAFLTNPVAVAVDRAGKDLYIADSASDAIRRVSLESPFVPVAPVRVLDTRVGVGAPIGKVPAGGVVEVAVGAAGVPADASAVVVNVTATEPDAPGFLTVYPCGAPPPLASNVNYVAGQNVPNLVIARLGADGKVCIYSLASAHVVADVSGWFPAGHAYQSLSPVRLVDTRTGLGAPEGKVPAGGTLTVAVSGNGIGADAAAVVLNVTATEPEGAGYLTVYPCGGDPPLASNLNYDRGQNVPNLVTAAVGPDGTVCIFSLTATHVVVDANGWFPDASAYRAVSPVRLLDTRDGTGASAPGKVPADGTVALHVAGVGGVPEDAVAVVLNVTVTEPDAAGFVTAWPCGQPRPLASNLNYAPGQNVPNLVTARIGVNGDVCLYTLASTHLIADLNGWHPD